MRKDYFKPLAIMMHKYPTTGYVVVVQIPTREIVYRVWNCVVRVCSTTDVIGIPCKLATAREVSRRMSRRPPEIVLIREASIV